MWICLRKVNGGRATQLEGITLIGRGITIMKSSQGQPTHGWMEFLPQQASAELDLEIAALRHMLPEEGAPVDLLERPLQGCTVVATVSAVSTVGLLTAEDTSAMQGVRGD